ncbi:hypothetical protein [Nitrobacter vulgaris]|uniref:hypothetical protein n=1 Tax=Nitrobacter vulgaris TaxID=29421 RepID=UPI001AECC26E|nr:hypothetical protein [Nitrobacter vulgaris]
MTKMLLAQHNNMIKALPSDRTDQPFIIVVSAMGSAATSVDRECPTIEAFE